MILELKDRFYIEYDIRIQIRIRFSTTKSLYRYLRAKNSSHPTHQMLKYIRYVI